MSERMTVAVHIESGTSLSDEANVGGHRIVGIQMPAGWDAAAMALQALVSQTGATATFGVVIGSDGNDLVLATGPAASEYVALADTAALKGLGRVKIRSGTAGVPVNQTADRDFFLVLVPD